MHILGSDILIGDLLAIDYGKCSYARKYQRLEYFRAESGGIYNADVSRL